VAQGQAEGAVKARGARSYELLIHDGPLPPLGVMLGQSPAEADFIDLQSNPKRRGEWARHCADARAAWHKRAGVKPRQVER
jgi:hypothetical protein